MDYAKNSSRNEIFLNNNKNSREHVISSPQTPVVSRFPEKQLARYTLEAEFEINRRVSHRRLDAEM